jgi:2-hydroxychromene-2-carboxylate isomerase
MRILCALKDAVGKGVVKPEVPILVAKRLWRALWLENKNTSELDVMQLELDTLLPGGWTAWSWAVDDVDVKKRLTELTQEALDSGCFGAPWWIIRNARGEEDVFFGSDRWEQIFVFLGEKWVGYNPLLKNNAVL